MKTWKALVLGGAVGVVIGLVMGLIGGLLLGGLLFSRSSREASVPTVGEVTPFLEEATAPASLSGKTLDQEALALYEQEVRARYSRCGDYWVMRVGDSDTGTIWQVKFQDGPTYVVNPRQLSPADRENGIEWWGRGRIRGQGVFRTWRSYTGGWSQWTDLPGFAATLFGMQMKKQNGEWSKTPAGQLRHASPIDCDQIPPD